LIQFLFDICSNLKAELFHLLLHSLIAKNKAKKESNDVVKEEADETAKLT